MEILSSLRIYETHTFWQFPSNVSPLTPKLEPSGEPDPKTKTRNQATMIVEKLPFIVETL
jgi:hypothetical protein